MQEPIDDILLAGMESLATDMARVAGALLMSYFGSPLDVEYKDEENRDPVTVADRKSQEYLVNTIARHFPDHSILAEEGQGSPATPAQDFVWVVDPLDGTKNFLAGLPIFACSIGVLYMGIPVAGALFIPWPTNPGGIVLHARKGGGAFMEQQPISVPRPGEPKTSSLMALPAGFGAQYRFQKPMRGKIGELRVTGSIAYELAMAAQGILEYSVTTGASLWDVAGGTVLVMEAGGLAMQGLAARGLRSMMAPTQWVPVKSLVPSWHSGTTTMKELRQWSAPMVLGEPSTVRYVTSNAKARLLAKRNSTRMVRRLRGRRMTKKYFK